MFRFGMFNSINGDRKYKAEDFAQYFATFIGNGIFVKPSDCLQIRGNGDSMSVIVRPGKAWVNGYYLINDEDYNLPLTVGDTTLNRIDRIVIRLDFIQRKMSVEVKKGALSASPVAPTLKRDADAYELALADVYIAKGALTITQGAITDTRLNNNLCGLMHNPIYQVDTTTIFNQYQGWFEDYSVTKAAEFLQWQNKVTSELEAWIDAQEKDFEAWRQAEEQLYYTWLQGRKDNFDKWFETVKDILDTTADGKLFNKIQEHEDASMPHLFLDETDAKTYQYGFKTNTERDGTVFMFKDVEDPHSPTTQIVGPTKKTQDEIREKVDNVGYLQDINGDIYKPRMDEQLMVGDTFLKPYSDVMGLMDGKFAFSFTSSKIFKYDLKTMMPISIQDVPTSEGNIVQSAQDRSYAQDDEFIYFLMYKPSTHTKIVKMRKDDMSYTFSYAYSPSTYGYFNRLIAYGDKLIVGHIDGGVTGAFLLNKSSMSLAHGYGLGIYGFLADFILDKDGYLITFARTAASNYGYISKYRLDGTLIGTHTTTHTVFNETSGSRSQARLYLSNKDGELYVSARGTYFGQINQATLVSVKIEGFPGDVDMFLMPTKDIYEFVGFTSKVITRMDVNTKQLISKIPMEKDLLLNQIMPFYVGSEELLYGGGTYNNTLVFVSLKTGYIISHYERSEM